MTTKLDIAISEAERFISTAKKLKAELAKQSTQYCSYAPKESGATKRASMDLTRALAAYRKPG